MEKKNRLDYLLLLLVYLVLSASIFTLYSQEVIVAEGAGRWYRQLLFAIFGSVIAFVLYRVNYQVIGSYAVPLYGFSIFLLLITLVPGIGSEIKGARSWIRIDPFGFQTSELAKLASIILLAKYLELKSSEMDRIPSLFLPFAIVLIPMLLIVVQPDFGGAFSLAPILLSMLFIAGADVYHIGSVFAFFGLSFLIPLYIEYYRITLTAPLVERLQELQKIDLVPAVRILSADIWKFVDESLIPSRIVGTDRAYLENILGSANLMTTLQETVSTIRYEGGGPLLLFLGNSKALIVVGAILSAIALLFFVVRFARGVTFSRLRKIYIPMGVCGISFLAAATVLSSFSFRYHQVARITAFVNPEQFPRDLAYQIRASKAAIGSGEIFGRGFWQGEMTIGNRPLVPEAYTDFIFTSWAERLGFAGSVILLFLLIAIPLRGLLLSSEARDRFGALLAAGISCMFFYHIAFNAGIALGLLPVTGLPLSFMSYGGSHLIICMSYLGLLLSIYRRRFAK